MLRNGTIRRCIPAALLSLFILLMIGTTATTAGAMASPWSGTIKHEWIYNLGRQKQKEKWTANLDGTGTVAFSPGTPVKEPFSVSAATYELHAPTSGGCEIEEIGSNPKYDGIPAELTVVYEPTGEYEGYFLGEIAGIHMDLTTYNPNGVCGETPEFEADRGLLGGDCIEQHELTDLTHFEVTCKSENVGKEEETKETTTVQLTLSPTTDSDGDSYTDVEELAAGTSPIDPNSHPSSHAGEEKPGSGEGPGSGKGSEEGGNGGNPNGPGWNGHEGAELPGGMGGLGGPGGGPPPPPGSKKPVYIALGDSFSSGEGACKPGGAREKCDYAASTNVTSGSNKDECHRSHNAYPELVRQNLPSNWGFVFAACSGDVIRELFHENKHWHALEPAEIDAIHHHENATEEVKLITMSIGGNDMGFSEVLKRCILQDCFYHPGDPGISLPKSAKDQPCGDRAGLSGLNLIEYRLTCAYTELGNAAPGAKLYVMGYPRLFYVGLEPGLCSLSDLQRQEVGRFEDRFNGRILNAVNAANRLSSHGPFAEFVNNRHTFEGHELCNGHPNSQEYLNPFLPAAGPPFHHPESFHPNAVGQEHLAGALEQAMGL